MSAIYDPIAYQAGFGEIALLWLTGLSLSFAMIVIHELGHVIAAHLVGIEISHITIGHWRKVISFQVGASTVVVRAAPATGYVQLKTTLHFYSITRMAALLLAGVFAEGITTGLVIYAHPHSSIHSFGDMMLVFSYINIVCIGAYHVIFNLLPTVGWVGGEKAPTDGMQLLGLWKQRRDLPVLRQRLIDAQEVDALCKAKRLSDAMQLLQKLINQSPSNYGLVQVMGRLHVESGELDKAEAVWRDLLKQPIGSSHVAIATMDSLSCLPLYHGLLHLLNEADSWTNTALRYSSGAITVKGTRGSVLIELGRIDEGMVLLNEVIKRTDCPVDRVICSAYLAKGFALKGASAEAKLWMEKAKAIDADHVVVKRLGKEQPFAGSPA